MYMKMNKITSSCLRG